MPPAIGTDFGVRLGGVAEAWGTVASSLVQWLARHASHHVVTEVEGGGVLAAVRFAKAKGTTDVRQLLERHLAHRNAAWSAVTVTARVLREPPLLAAAREVFGGGAGAQLLGWTVDDLAPVASGAEAEAGAGATKEAEADFFTTPLSGATFLPAPAPVSGSKRPHPSLPPSAPKPKRARARALATDKSGEVELELELLDWKEMMPRGGGVVLIVGEAHSGETPMLRAAAAALASAERWAIDPLHATINASEGGIPDATYVDVHVCRGIRDLAVRDRKAGKARALFVDHADLRRMGSDFDQLVAFARHLFVTIVVTAPTVHDVPFRLRNVVDAACIFIPHPMSDAPTRQLIAPELSRKDFVSVTCAVLGGWLARNKAQPGPMHLMFWDGPSHFIPTMLPCDDPVFDEVDEVDDADDIDDSAE